MLYGLFLLACITFMVMLFRRCCLYEGRVHINPVFGLLLGLFFYVLLPSTVIYYFADLIDQWTVYGRELSQGNAEIVMGFTFTLLVAFWMGSSVWVGGLPRRPSPPPSSLGTRWTSGATWPATLTMIGSMLLFGLLAFSIRDSLFAGYDEEVLANDSVWAARGAMSSFYSMFYVALCVFVLRRRTRMSRPWKLLVGLSFVASSIILLSMGARLYVAMALISMLALRSAVSNGIPTRQLTMFLLGGVALMGSVGVLRSGAFSGVESLLRNVVLEPLLTSISLYTLLSNNAPIWIGQVHLFLADFQAVLPSVLFPEKAGLFMRLEEYGYSFEAPVGGYHLYFSGLINFGFVGMWLIALAVGYGLAKISRRPITGPIRTSTLVTAIYLSGALTFTVFRDPFFIAVVKNVMVMALVLPVVLTGFNRRIPGPTPSSPQAISS